MFELIERLRQKPERVKKQIAFFAALAFSGLIFVVWLSIVYPDFKKGGNDNINNQTSEPGPLSNFSKNFINGVSDLKKEFSSIKDSVASYSSSSVHYSATDTNATTTNSLK